MTKVADIKPVQTKAGISEYRLPSNDLRVLHRFEASSPIVMVMVTYHVGSRNEAAGYTGATHILEHLLFKGSTNFNKQNGKLADILLSNIGAKLNATTWFDRTNYWEVVPKEHVELALAIEADRMRGALFTKEDLASEMTVVRNEYERYRNDPLQILDEEVWATAFHAHPYHHPTIGWKTDIENVPVERLRQFYDTFYWPNNATLTILGDIAKKEALRLADTYFGRIPKSPHSIPEVYTQEPPQEGQRFVQLERKGQTTNLVCVAHKNPEGLSSDTHALHVLDKVLLSGKSGRLYKALVDRGLASEVFIMNSPFKDPGLHSIFAYLTRGTKHDEVARRIESVLSELAAKGPTTDEVKRARKQLLVESSFDRDGVYCEGSVLNETLAMGDWTFYPDYMDRISSVTPAAVKKVARQYFTKARQTLGYFVA